MMNHTTNKTTRGLSKLALLSSVLLAAALFVGCAHENFDGDRTYTYDPDGTADELGDRVEDAAEDTEDNIEEAVDETEDAFDDAFD